MTTAPPRLFSTAFLCLMGVTLLAFCNISVFYGFEVWLERAGYAPNMRGLLLGLEPLTAFLLRPAAGMLLTPRNAVRSMLAAILGNALALTCYQWTGGPLSIAAVRALHGASFVVLVSASASLLVLLIPRERTGQAYGLFSIATLLPYAIMPPLVERLLAGGMGEPAAYAAVAPVVLLALPLLIPVARRVRALSSNLDASFLRRPSLDDLREFLRRPAVRLLLAANFCVFLATTQVYFFVKAHALDLGVIRPGLFFSVSVAATIAMRLIGANLFDRTDRRIWLLASSAVLSLAIYGLAVISGPAAFLPLAALYGACLGVLMPLLNAAMFHAAPPHLRGLGANLMLFAMDAGFGLAPLVAGGVLAVGLGMPDLFRFCSVVAGVCLICLAVFARLGHGQREGEEKESLASGGRGR